MVRRPLFAIALAACSLVVAGVLSAQDSQFQLASQDASGQLRTLDVNGPVDTSNPFFQDLGTNGRRCTSCHLPDQGWTITPERVQAKFDETAGLDPVFRTNDGSNCENADVSTLDKRRQAYSLLLDRGLIRVGINVPANAEFSIVAVDDPYNCPSNFISPLPSASMYRRPLPSTNLNFLTAIMWDGREPSLAQQSNDATRGHAAAAADLTTDQRNAIVAFETGLFTAQARDDAAGSLTAEGAEGGPKALSQQTFFTGINDPVGLNPTGAPFNPSAFTIFKAWASIEGNDSVADVRRSIARGQDIFNTKQFTISGVAGLNGFTFPNGVTAPESFSGTCTICHDSPNVGNHSVKAPLNIGLTDASRRTPDMPLYTLRRLDAKGHLTKETVQTTDPGRAMITGKWADIGKFKGPILRGLAGRAPYFHNGSARTLTDVVNFYDSRFRMGLHRQEKEDLAAFLRSL